MGQALLALGLLLITAKVLEGIAIRLQQSTLLAYLAAGIILGPALNVVKASVELDVFFAIGVVLMFFLIGIDEMDVSGLMATIRGRFFIAGLIAFAVPLGIGLAVMLTVVQQPLPNAIALAGVLALSSVAVVAKVLSDLGRLKDPLGLEVFTTVVIVEIIGLLVVAFSLQQVGHPEDFSSWKVPVMLVEVVAFAVVAWVLARRVFPPLIVWLRRYIGAPQLTLGLILGALLLAVAGLENIGVHGALGGLLLGVALSGLPHRLRAEIIPGVRGLAQGLFVPLFFASAGLYLSLSFTELPWLTTVAIVLAAVLGKFVGAVLGVRLARLDRPLALASGLMGKGAIEIALLLVMLEMEAISPELFSLLTLIMVCFIVLLAPAMAIGIRRAGAAEKPALPKLVFPSYVRYAESTPAVKDVMDKSRQFPAAGISAQQFVDMWVTPDQQDYVVASASNGLAGVVSLQDLRRLPKGQWKQARLEDLVRRDPPVARPDEPLDDVLTRMATSGLSVVPVVNPETGALLASVNNTDVVAWMMRSGERGVG